MVKIFKIHPLQIPKHHYLRSFEKLSFHEVWEKPQKYNK